MNQKRIVIVISIILLVIIISLGNSKVISNICFKQLYW